MAERLTQKDAAARLVLSPRQLRDLTARQIITRQDDGKYLWPDIRAEYDAFKAKDAEKRKSGFGNQEYLEGRARKVTAEAEKAELDLEARKGNLISVLDLEVLVTRSLEPVDTILRNAPAKHAPELAKVAGITEAQARRLLANVLEGVRTDLREVPRRAG